MLQIANCPVKPIIPVVIPYKYEDIYKVIYSLCDMALGRKEEKVVKKSCSCVKNEGRDVYCLEHGDQRYRTGQESIP